MSNSILKTFMKKSNQQNNIFVISDLKTQNIFLTRQNIIKVGDFGIARLLSGEGDKASTTIGTPYYLSPEICQKVAYPLKQIVYVL